MVHHFLHGAALTHSQVSSSPCRLSPQEFSCGSAACAFMCSTCGGVFTCLIADVQPILAHREFVETQPDGPDPIPDRHVELSNKRGCPELPAILGLTLSCLAFWG